MIALLHPLTAATPSTALARGDPALLTPEQGSQPPSHSVFGVGLDGLQLIVSFFEGARTDLAREGGDRTDCITMAWTSGTSPNWSCYNRPLEVLSLYLALFYIHASTLCYAMFPLVPRSSRVLRMHSRCFPLYIVRCFLSFSLSFSLC